MGAGGKLYKPGKVRLVRDKFSVLSNLGEQQEGLPRLQGQELACQLVRQGQGQVQEQRQEAVQVQPQAQVHMQPQVQVQLAGRR